MRVEAALRTDTVDSRPVLLYIAVDRGARVSVPARLSRIGVPMALATDSGDALRLLGQQAVTLAVLDLAGNQAALAAVRVIRAKYPNLSIAAINDPTNPLIAGEAIQAGVREVIPWPIEDRDVLTVLSNARDLVAMEPAQRDETVAAAEIRLVAQSPAMRSVVERIHAVANSRTSMLLAGEAGTGRSLLARVVHHIASGIERRAHVPFVVEDCADHAPEALERLLFGSIVEGRRTARSAATFDRIGPTGAIYRARYGTLFVKNLLDAPARIQGRLARLLRDREAELVDQPGTLVDLDIRLIASVSLDVNEAVGDGRMRADLYERLAQVRIDVPPLRRRREDIPVLAVLLLKALCDAQNLATKAITRSALKLLSALPWSGNAEELRTLLDILIRSVDRPVIQLDDVLEHASFEGAGVRWDAGVSLRDARARFERECISAVLARHHGRVGDAAKALGIQRTNLYRKVRQLQVVRPRQPRRSGQ